MPLIYSFAQSGVSIQCKSGSDADFGALGNLASSVDGAFAFGFDAQFLANGECVFFGGAGTGSRELYITRNYGGSNDGAIRFSSIDASGDERTVLWNPSTSPILKWRRYIFNSTAAGSGNLKLYVDGVEATIASQTHDAGFDADEAFDLSFGEVDAGKIVPFNFTGVHVFNRALTAAEIAEAVKGRYPTDYVRAYPFYFPNIGLSDASLIPPLT